MAMLESSAVVVLNGMFKNPIIPKLIAAVRIIGTALINPILMFLNMNESSAIIINSERIRLFI